MFEFRPWGRFGPVHDKNAVRRFLRDGAKIALKTFKDGLRNPPKTGRVYKRKGGLHQASINKTRAEYPARESGALLKSANSRVANDEFEIGSNMYYSRFLRDGTSKMRRRKMSDTALTESSGRCLEGLHIGSAEIFEPRDVT
jgi:hypothetical protein